MEFNFNINNYFKDEITKIGSRLIPDGFVGDRREVQDCLSKISYILTVLGEKSARAQGLQKVITSGEKLRNSDHVVYILVDSQGGSKGYGTVLGMLKMGVKHLYVFDAGGRSHEVTTKCVLDFYVHESKQRMGLGKKLFQHMLKEERVDPVHLAIDKPSPKFLSFLVKHYDLETIIPQMNNFVVFDGFFSNRSFGGGSKDNQKLYPGTISSHGSIVNSGSTGCGSPSAASSEIHLRSQRNSNHQSPSAINLNNMSYYGRQALHKPISTMGMILQQKPAPSQQPTQSGSNTTTDTETKSSPSKTREEEEVQETTEEVPNVPEETPDETDNTNGETSVISPDVHDEEPKPEPVKDIPEVPKPPQEKLKLSLPVAPAASVSPTPSEPRSRLNSQGHLDLKFYHSSLW